LIAGRALSGDVAKVISHATKSRPIWSPRTPRWILRCFEACGGEVPVHGGTFQLNRVADDTGGQFAEADGAAAVSSSILAANYARDENAPVDTSVAMYDQVPRRIPLETVQSIVRTSTRAEALFSETHDQLQSQIQVTSEYMYETVESLVFNHPEHGLLNNVDDDMRYDADAPASPDVLDELLARAWKRPDCFVMNPRALASFHRQATAGGLNLESLELFGSIFTSWRGLPILPSDKLQLRRGEEGEGSEGGGSVTSSILLMRCGQENQGVVRLIAAENNTHPALPHISIEPMGRTDNAVASYLLTTFTAVAVLSPGALACARVTI
jgi:hypothetical protein